jgi:hypothetical protein
MPRVTHRQRDVLSVLLDADRHHVWLTSSQIADDLPGDHTWQGAARTASSLVERRLAQKTVTSSRTIAYRITDAGKQVVS